MNTARSTSNRCRRPASSDRIVPRHPVSRHRHSKTRAGPMEATLASGSAPAPSARTIRRSAKRAPERRELVDGAAGGEPVEPAERGDDGLPDPFALAAVLDDLEVLVRSGPLDTDEHGGAPFGAPHILKKDAMPAMQREIATMTACFSHFHGTTILHAAPGPEVPGR